MKGTLTGGLEKLLGRRMELETADTAKEFLDKIERELPAEISNQILDVIQAHKARQASGDQGEEVVREVVLKMEKLLVGAPVVRAPAHPASTGLRPSNEGVAEEGAVICVLTLAARLPGS